MNKNLYALLFVVATQTACAAYYSMELPDHFGPSSINAHRDF